MTRTLELSLALMTSHSMKAEHAREAQNTRLAVKHTAIAETLAHFILEERFLGPDDIPARQEVWDWFRQRQAVLLRELGAGKSPPEGDDPFARAERWEQLATSVEEAGGVHVALFGFAWADTLRWFAVEGHDLMDELDDIQPESLQSEVKQFFSARRKALERER